MVAPDQVRGIGVVVVPFVGLPALWIERGEWLPLAAVVAGLMLAGFLSRSTWAELGNKAFRL